MKLLSKAKKALWGVGIFFIALKNKVAAISPGELLPYEVLYGPPKELTLYEKSKDTIDAMILASRILAFIVIPLILILGIVAYVKKGKESKFTKKFKLILITAVIILVLLLVVLLIIYKMVS